MQPTVFDSPTWHRALTLSERKALLQANGSAGSPAEFDEKLGQKRFLQWQAQPQFETETILEQRLQIEDIDEEHLRQILGLPDDFLSTHSVRQAAWLVKLAEAYDRPPTAYVNLEAGQEELGFLELIQPLVDQVCDRLFEGVEELINKWPYFPFVPEEIENILLMNLPDPLLQRLSRTMVLELNVARLQDRLSGSTPAERYISFIEALRQREQSLTILAEYPVLARQLALCLDQWLEVSLEFLDRLCADWPAICSHFDITEDPGPLRELVGGAGDTHRGGRSVMIARFESGFQVVYKPKSMAVDVHFQELLAWLNERGCQPALRPMTILDRAQYGWVEYVENESCHSLAEIKRFYRRLGAYLALLYAINASDFHLENLIASGDQPMLIDLETLFNPEFERFVENEATGVAARSMLRSVLSVGMLPQRLWSAEDYGGIDISGLGGEEGQMSPDRLPRAAAAGTDEMHFERERVPLTAESNRPRLNGVEASALDYAPDVLAGFRNMYQLLLANQDDLLADPGPIACFRQDETRVLLRPTRTYDQLLFESFHPDTLRDALDRGLLLDRLWMVVPQRPFMAHVINAEQGDLLQGDIPVFTTTPTSLCLFAANGEPISDVLTETGMEIAVQRIKQLGRRDLQRQEWFIRSSLATLEPYEYGSEFQENPHYHFRETAGKAPRAQLRASAQAIAEQLLNTAVLSQQDVTWLGLELLADESWDISPAGMDLYNGLPGIALFLAYAGTLLDKPQYSDLARMAAQAVLRHVQMFGQELPGIGAFEGWSGILYVLTHLGILWQDEELLAQAADLVDVIARFTAEDEDYSVTGGAAGAIAALLALYNCRPDPMTLETAVSCADHLLSSAKQSEQGLCWENARYNRQPLLGFAHGAAGIAWALLELSAVSGQGRFADTAVQALNYERSYYSAAAQNWPDLRQNDRDGQTTGLQEPRYPVAFCFGAAGTGLSLLRAQKQLQDPQLETEIKTALNTTIAHGFGQTHCLCHGDLGNIELLLQAQQAGIDPALRSKINELSAMIDDSINRHGWHSGGPGAVEMPGLMLGLSGIGYQLLRLAEPNRVPSILLLAPPPPVG